jgi:N-acetylglucosamine kinase-like BadF-type ATPase
VLAVDGGNSKTDLALVAADGTVLAAVRGAGTRGAGDLAGTLELITGLTRRAQEQAGLAAPAGEPAARHLSACMANADLPEEEESLAAALRSGGLTASTAVRNDTFAVLRSGLRPGELAGVAVTCGAGINCVGVAPGREPVRFLSLGLISGDWGGGLGLGFAALWWAVRAEDGRGPQTALAGAIARHFGVATATDVTIGIHYGTIGQLDLRHLAPVVLAAAQAGDQVARGLVNRQAEEICAMAVTALRRLSLLDGQVPVVLGGGVLAAGDPLLIAGITGRLAGQAPHAVIRVAGVPPVAGAALLGLDHLGAGPEAERRLRASYAGDMPDPAAGPGRPLSPGQPQNPAPAAPGV